MKRTKILSRLFAVLALTLSHLMCVVVTYNWCNLQWGIRSACYSAPARTAFLLVIPYAAGIAVCVLLALVLRRR